MGVDPVHLALLPPRLAALAGRRAGGLVGGRVGGRVGGLPIPDDRAQQVVPVTEDVRLDPDAVAHAALGGIRVRRRPPGSGTGSGCAGAAPRARCQGSSASRLGPGRSRINEHASPLERHSTPPHLAARRPPRPCGVRVRRLACGRGPNVVADIASRPTGPLPLTLQGPLGLRGLPGPAGIAPRACERGCHPGLQSAPFLLDRGLGALCGPRRDRGPGPIRAGMGIATPVRGRAGGDAARRRRDLRRAAERRPPCSSGAVPARFRGRGPARRVLGDWAAVGKSALRLACSAARRDIDGGSSVCDARSSCSMPRGSTTSEDSWPTGPSPPGARRR